MRCRQIAPFLSPLFRSSLLLHLTTSFSFSLPHCSSHPLVRHFSSSSSSSSSTPHILFLVGGPCAGKGTQSHLLVNEFGADVTGKADGTTVNPSLLSHLNSLYPPLSNDSPRPGVVHISIGALLREELQGGKSSKWSAIIHEAMRSGLILPGELTVDLLAQEMWRVREEQRRINDKIEPVFIVDGFPRSMDNVKHFTAKFGSPRALLHLLCPDEELKRRLKARVATSSRFDDTEEVMDKRIRTYHGDTMIVLKWWKEQCERRRTADREEWPRMWELDGQRSIEEVYKDVRQVYLTWTAMLQLHRHNENNPT